LLPPSLSAVYGGAGNDQIDIWLDSAAHGGDGDDTIRAWSSTVVLGGNGNDTISAGPKVRSTAAPATM
jgi:Ca2+-binding RTX toxin-like protein